MNKVLLISILFSSPYIQAWSQTDSAAAILSRHEAEIEFIRDNLKKSHIEFKTGLQIAVCGGIVGAASAFIDPPTNKNGSKDYSLNTGLAIVGSAIGMIGAVFMIDSHKYIGRAGRWKFSGNSVAFEF